jgi:hypothetical protein
MNAAAQRLSPTDRAKLDEHPWLEPFIADGDTSLEPARERYGKVMAEARAELRAAGATLYRRIRTANGHETTALQTHPKGAP